jgi:hypothetical protein
MIMAVTAREVILCCSVVEKGKNAIISYPVIYALYVILAIFLVIIIISVFFF